MLFLIKKTSIAMKYFESLICPVWRFSAMNIFSSNYFIRYRGYTFNHLGLALEISLIA